MRFSKMFLHEVMKSDFLLANEYCNPHSVVVFQISYIENVMKFFSGFSTAYDQDCTYCCTLRPCYLQTTLLNKIYLFIDAKCANVAHFSIFHVIRISCIIITYPVHGNKWRIWSENIIFIFFMTLIKCKKIHSNWKILSNDEITLIIFD